MLGCSIRWSRSWLNRRLRIIEDGLEDRSYFFVVLEHVQVSLLTAVVCGALSLRFRQSGVEMYNTV